MKLTGEAETKFDYLPNKVKTNYTKAKIALKRYFTKKVPGVKSEWRSLKQKASETVGEYADRVRRAHRADEHINPNDEIYKEDLIDTFIEGLRKDSIRRSLINNMPEGWDAVVRKAKTLEVYSDKGADISVLGPYFNEVNGPRDGNSDNSKLFQCMISCIEGMTKKLDEMQTQRQNIEMQQLCKELDNIAVEIGRASCRERV